MEIIEQTPIRLTLRFQRRGLAFGGILGAILGVFVLIFLWAQGLSVFQQRYDSIQLITLLIWSGVIGIFVGAMGFVGLGAARGTICSFDKITALVTIKQARGWRITQESRTLYGVKGLLLEHNPTLGVLAIYLSFRAGESLWLATSPDYDAQKAQDIAKLVKDFLQAG